MDRPISGRCIAIDRHTASRENFEKAFLEAAGHERRHVLANNLFPAACAHARTEVRVRMKRGKGTSERLRMIGNKARLAVDHLLQLAIVPPRRGIRDDRLTPEHSLVDGVAVALAYLRAVSQGIYDLVEQALLALIVDGFP